MTLAPIALFVYNRPTHTEQTLEALFKNIFAKESTLYIFCDGPKAGATIEDLDMISRTRAIIKSKQWCKDVIVKEYSTNQGLANSIISGVTEVLNAFDSIIVLEDDILAGPGFLKYMNDALNVYKEEEKVGCIHAWNYDLDMADEKASTFFLKGADCWGWATWKRGWEHFNADGSFLLKHIKKKNLEYEFNRRGTYDYLNMLKNQINGKNDSWAIRWHASLFIHNMFCLQPVKPIVRNIGLDNSGTHCTTLKIEQQPVDYINVQRIEIVEDDLFFESYRRSLEKGVKMNRFEKITNLFKAVMRKIGNRY